MTSAGKPPRLELRYGWSDSAQGFRTRVTLKHRAAGQSFRLEAMVDWEREILAQRPSQAQVQYRVRRIRLIRPSALRDALAPRLRTLNITLTVDDRGRVLAAKPKATLPSSVGASMLQRLSAPLPADPVGDGATWERSEPVTLSLPHTRHRVRLGVRTRYRLSFERRRGQERYAQIAATMKLTAQSSQGYKLTGQRASGAGSGRATLKLDLQRKTIISADSEQSLSLDVQGYGRSQQLKQHLKTRTQLIKLPPRPPTP